MKLVKALRYAKRNRLNPFEFRAGLKRATMATLRTAMRLNPFEFRAGLKPFRKQ